jgi:hypothetical protein
MEHTDLEGKLRKAVDIAVELQRELRRIEPGHPLLDLVLMNGPTSWFYLNYFDVPSKENIPERNGTPVDDIVYSALCTYNQELGLALDRVQTSSMYLLYKQTGRGGL